MGHQPTVILIVFLAVCSTAGHDNSRGKVGIATDAIGGVVAYGASASSSLSSERQSSPSSSSGATCIAALEQICERMVTLTDLHEQTHPFGFAVVVVVELLGGRLCNYQHKGIESECDAKEFEQ